MKAVIFDLDGTIYDYNNAHKKALEQTAKYIEELFGLEKTYFLNNYENARIHLKSKLKNHTSSHSRFLYFQNFFEKLGLNPLLYTESTNNYYWTNFFKNMMLFQWVSPTIKLLKSKDIKIGICSDYNTEIQFSKLNHLGIANYFDCVVTSEEIGVEKPDPMIFKLVFEKMSISLSDKNEVYFVGDDYEKDFLGAINFGMKAVHFKNQMDIYELFKNESIKINF